VEYFTPSFVAAVVRLLAALCGLARAALRPREKDMAEKTTAAPRLYTVGEAAQKLGCQGWMVRRLFERGLLPEPPRLGITRALREDQLPEVGRLVREHGYLKA
jgi:hypothetical protein